MADKEYAYLAALGYTGSLADKRNAYYNDLILNGGDADLPSTGIFVPPRLNNTSTASTSSGAVYLQFFTSPRAFTSTGMTTYTAGTAAGATPTLCRYGLYSVASSGDLTLVASTANDTALWAATSTAYRKAWSSSYDVQAGQRYAAALLIVTGAATPILVATATGSATISGVLYAVAPRLVAVNTGQTDLPASISSGSLSNTGNLKTCFLD